MNCDKKINLNDKFQQVVRTVCKLHEVEFPDLKHSNISTRESLMCFDKLDESVITNNEMLCFGNCDQLQNKSKSICSEHSIKKSDEQDVLSFCQNNDQFDEEEQNDIVCLIKQSKFYDQILLECSEKKYENWYAIYEKIKNDVTLKKYQYESISSLFIPQYTIFEFLQNQKCKPNDEFCMLVMLFLIQQTKKYNHILYKKIPIFNIICDFLINGDFQDNDKLYEHFLNGQKNAYDIFNTQDQHMYPQINEENKESAENNEIN